MRRNAIVTVAVVIAILALASQLAIPALVSSEVEDRLTENGGSAHVEVHAFPAVRLIGGDGDRIEIRARDLRIDLPPAGGDVFDRLDGFAEVDAQLTNVRTGPFRVERFVLQRGEGEGTYRMVMQASSTPCSSSHAMSSVGASSNARTEKPSRSKPPSSASPE